VPRPTKPVEHTAEATPRAPTADECQLLVRHAIQVSIAERPADQQISKEEQAKVVADMRCEGVTRGLYDCAMAASTTAAMASCDQRMPSSSTSNSSVAPGGMTPPAPRAP
jgi:hypothetical protein